MSKSQLSLLNRSGMPNFSLSGSDLKDELIGYMRDKARGQVETSKERYPASEYEEEHKKRASHVNDYVNDLRSDLEANLVETSNKEDWSNEELLPKILALEHAKNVVILESRNDVWSYEYMSFSRRIGEIWEPFCHICYRYSIEPIEFFSPPSFSDIRQRLRESVSDFINNLNISEDKKEDLTDHYESVWLLVHSGDINMNLDLHFQDDQQQKFNVDFKSGFSSNEKGNVNRLLMVATIYDKIDWQDYECILLVRSSEERNNNYFKKLKRSDVWDAYCGEGTYDKIEEHTGFDLSSWVNNNVEWKQDFRDDVTSYIEEQNLDKYLIW